MKKVILVCLASLMILAGASALMAQEEQASAGTKSSIALAPFVQKAEGSAGVSLTATRYPDFVSFSSDNQKCGDFLKGKYAECNEQGVAQGGMSGAPLWCKSRLNGRKRIPADPGFSPVPGLNLDVTIPPEYKNLADILVTWTVRVEVEEEVVDGSTAETKVMAYDVWPGLCSVWHGTISERFTGGNMYTKVKVSDSTGSTVNDLTSQEFAMDIPFDGLIHSFNRKHDPTQTGSFMIKKSDFKGEYPSQINVQVFWKNDTSLKIISPAGQRNVIVTVVPSLNNDSQVTE